MFQGRSASALAGRALLANLGTGSARYRVRPPTGTAGGRRPAGRRRSGMVLRADVPAAAIDAADTAQDRPKRSTKAADEPTGSAAWPSCGSWNSPPDRAPDRLQPLRGHRQAGRTPRGLEEVSIGNYVTGGEMPRHGADRRLRAAFTGRSWEAGLGTDEAFRRTTRIPQYIPAREFEGRPIPEILTSGDHARSRRRRRPRPKR